MNEAMKRALAVLAVLVALPLLARAQAPVTQADSAELTADIVAIDHDARLVTLRDKDGVTQTIYAGPQVKRFDELKIGDSVTFRYTEALVYKIRKPGESAAAPASSGPTITRGTGARPSGTVAQQQTGTVTIKAIDLKVPSVTVLRADGRTVSLKVEEKKNLEGFKVGDKVEITYTEALMISVK
jgi:Cu/Ag efflux protein CusF